MKGATFAGAYIGAFACGLTSFYLPLILSGDRAEKNYTELIPAVVFGAGIGGATGCETNACVRFVVSSLSKWRSR